MNVDNVKAQIKEARAVINEKEDFVRSARQSLAVYLCPFSVGEEVVNPDGKTEIIANIFPRAYSGGYGFTTYKIKKNGGPYINSHEPWYTEKYTKLN